MPVTVCSPIPNFPSVFPLKMTILLVLFPLMLLHGYIQVFQPAQASLALPLAVRSPYLSYWLPQNGSANISDQFHLAPTKSDLYQVCLFLQSE